MLVLACLRTTSKPLHISSTLLLRRNLTSTLLETRASPAATGVRHTPLVLSALRARSYATQPQEPTLSSPAVKQEAPAAPTPKPKRSLFGRLLSSSGEDPSKSASSFRSIVSLARPEKKPLGIAIGLLFVSSSVSMSIPFTIGKLIDFFTTTNPVSGSFFGSRSRMCVYTGCIYSKYHLGFLSGKRRLAFWPCSPLELWQTLVAPYS